MKFITNLLNRLRGTTITNMSADKRAHLLKKITQQGFPKQEAFVTVEEFFDGNNDESSIGGNIFPDPPGLDKFRRILTEINNSAKTTLLLIRIGDADDEEWFYSDAVYVVGDYSINEVNQMFEPLKPDEVYNGFMYGEPTNLPQTNYVQSYSVWWD